MMITLAELEMLLGDVLQLRRGIRKPCGFAPAHLSASAPKWSALAWVSSARRASNSAFFAKKAAGLFSWLRAARSVMFISVVVQGIPCVWRDIPAVPHASQARFGVLILLCFGRPDHIMIIPTTG
jgi:hypothetical protein